MGSIVTKTGDDGRTGLYGAARVPKNAPRIEAYGTVDELNASIGMALAEEPPEFLRAALERIHRYLFLVGSDLATPLTSPAQVQRVERAETDEMEKWVREWEAQLPVLHRFILPGGSRLAAILHLARTICRRAERRVVTLAANDTINPEVGIYLNRLSDCLFMLARAANKAANRPDVEI